ncbi:MAG TPA: putative 2OG-Fe(II) oxygenase [Allosphingosinicella sp.]
MNAQAAWLLRATDPADSDAVYRATLIAMEHGLAEEALPLAQAGAEAHPGDARMWQVLALASRDLEDLAPAVEAIGRAAALAPHDPLIAHTRARAAMEAGLPSSHLFEPARRLSPGDMSVLLGEVAALFGEGRLDDAIALLEEQLRTDPLRLEAQATLARLRWMRGERDSFTSGFEAAAAAAPRDVAIWREWTDTLMHAALYDQALATIDRGRAAMGGHLAFDALETVCRAEKGETEAADRLFARLGSIEHVTMATRYVRHLLRAGRPKEAAAFAEGWRARDPGHFMIPYLSAAWRLTGDPRWHWLEGDKRLIGIYDLADDIPSLADLAERLRGLHLSLHHPLEQSLRGGTQTDGPLFSRIEPEIRALRAAIVKAVEAHIAQLPPPQPGHPILIGRRAPIRFAGSWSVRLTDAGYHVNHVHPQGWISSAFYVSLPDDAMGGPEHAGWLSIGEATELGLDLEPIRLIEPKPGRLVLFPSTMWHGTRPFAAGERLTVAFDVGRPRQ